MTILLSDVIIPAFVYPFMYWPFTLAGLALVAVAIILFRYLKKKKHKDSNIDKE